MSLAAADLSTRRAARRCCCGRAEYLREILNTAVLYHTPAVLSFLEVPDRSGAPVLLVPPR